LAEPSIPLADWRWPAVVVITFTVCDHPPAQLVADVAIVAEITME
jgi:hypothetical protein